MVDRLRRTVLVGIFISVFAASSADAATLTLAWDPSPDPSVTGYIVYIGTTSGSYYTSIDVGNTTTAQFAQAQANLTYYFVVAAYAGGLVGALSTEVSAVAATSSPGSVTLAWDRSGDVSVTGYLVYVGTRSGAYDTTIDVGNTTSTQISRSSPDTTYYFSVAARAGTLIGPRSPEVSTAGSQTPVAPSLTNPGTQSSRVGSAMSLQLQATDSRGTALTFNATGLPPGLLIGQTSGLIAGTPSTLGTYGVVVTASNGSASASQSFTWTVVSTTPTLVNPGNQSTRLNTQASLQLQGSDPGGDAVTYSATGLPPGLQLTASTGLIRGTATSTGTYSVRATASNGSASTSQSFTWAVTTTAPSLSNPGNQNGTVGVAQSLQLQAADTSGAPLSFSATGLPPGLLVTSSTGLVAGIPTTAGTYTVSAIVSNGSLSASQAFTWTISGALPPTPAPPPPTPTVVLSASGYRNGNNKIVNLTWIGSTWAKVDIYRNGAKVASGRTNTGAYTDKTKGGTSTYSYTVCQAGSTTACSNTVSLRL